jgi:hypothetical protein
MAEYMHFALHGLDFDEATLFVLTEHLIIIISGTTALTGADRH